MLWIPDKYPTNENEVIDVRYPYALTKRLGEEILVHYSNIYNFKAISLRLFNVYGLNQELLEPMVLCLVCF